ncbi:hypothetical protein NBCG_03088 [Nocardioidaceae bacterium Broad-1]|uniref:hypothetical protein n=1 Tax=Nocardioides luteus TaxID=1844 RepID=UPI00020290ED|nr:hypothetical protein [Nocardioides luteus]EGD42500.1 hypothetical protein NBCG_03088 [Nocardioidaceae bacterium Broad-1]MBG6096466.1 hypothetical protein [Nocardioides luteus]
MTAMPAVDPTMDAITAAVTLGREGDVTRARDDLLAIWADLGVSGDPLHRCVLAHYLADLYTDAAVALIWDVRALDAADALTDQRAQEHEASLQVAGFYPSLHLNIADNLRRLGAFEAATEHIGRAEEGADALPLGPYGDMIRAAIGGIGAAIATRDTAPRATSPSVGGAG